MRVSPNVLLGCLNVHTLSDKFEQRGATRGCLGFLTHGPVALQEGVRASQFDLATEPFLIEDLQD